VQDLKSQFDLVTPEEFAQLRNVTTGTLANERSRGEGPAFVKVGGKVMYTREGMRKYIAQNTVNPKAAPTLINAKSRSKRASYSQAA
jgi:hypothetical protein